MKTDRKILQINQMMACLVMLLFIIPIDAIAEVKIGVNAPRGAIKAAKRWMDFGEYIEQKISQKVVIIPTPPHRILSSARENLFDFVLTNPALTVELVVEEKALLLATLNTLSGSQFAGVILVRKDSGFNSVDDLRGKNVMSLKFNDAAGAYIFQTYHLKQKGIDVHSDFASIKQRKKQDNLIMALNASAVDAVFVRTGILEAMHKEGRINKDDFIALDAHAEDEVKALHSTSHYPEWFLSAMPNTDKKTVEKVKKFSLLLHPDSQVAKRAKIRGFVEPLSLDGMKAALKSLKITPYEN